MESYLAGEVDEVYLVYNRVPLGGGRSGSTRQQLLPIQADAAARRGAGAAAGAGDYIFEPQPRGVLGALLPRLRRAPRSTARCSNRSPASTARA